MIDRGYCQVMARYNVWQNNQLTEILKGLPAKELTRNVKAFFGSILGTLSHLYWGDHIWMSRFDGGSAPECGIDDSPRLFATLATWCAGRPRMDGRIRMWADRVDNAELAGDIIWYSNLSGKQVTRPMGRAVTHFFNHQTHHRGQVHAMLTAAGSPAPVSDLIFMPEEI